MKSINMHLFNFLRTEIPPATAKSGISLPIDADNLSALRDVTQRLKESGYRISQGKAMNLILRTALHGGAHEIFERGDLVEKIEAPAGN